jgi:PAS domain S-box-containing protein
MRDIGRHFPPAGLAAPESLHTAPANAQGLPPFHLLADAMPQLVWMANGDGVVEYYNTRANEYAGIATTPEGTWEWSPVVHPDDLAHTIAAWTAAVADGSLYQCEHRVHMADGTYRWHLSRGVPVRHEGRVIKWFGTATDIHSLKVAEEALRESSRHKDEFLAVLAHELRNPLAPIRNALELMRDHPLDATLQRLHGMLDRQVAQMVRLVDDLLEISRISRGDIRLEIAPVSLDAVLSSAVETVAPALRAGGQSLTLPDAPTGEWLDGDAVRLAQAFSNLLSNAIKFTPREGGIGVRVERTPEYVTVTVADTGIGIPAEMLERVFDMFTQAQPAGSRLAGGLGIGLALVRRIVELHGGSVTARSAGAGSGSTFVVQLPRRAATAPPA